MIAVKINEVASTDEYGCNVDPKISKFVREDLRKLIELEINEYYDKLENPVEIKLLLY